MAMFLSPGLLLGRGHPHQISFLCPSLLSNLSTFIFPLCTKGEPHLAGSRASSNPTFYEHVT